MRAVLILLLLLTSSSLLPAKDAQPYQSITGCVWKDDRWNDGDSFHVITGDEQRELVVRL